MSDSDQIDVVEKLSQIRYSSSDPSLGDTLTQAIVEITKLRRELDEARRSCCEFAAMRRSCCEFAAIVAGADDTTGMESGRFHEIAMNYMRDRGWDCFKDESKS